MTVDINMDEVGNVKLDSSMDGKQKLKQIKLF